MVKRVDPTLTDKEAKIGHSKFLDIVDSYDVFRRQFQPGNVWYREKLTDNQYIVY